LNAVELVLFWLEHVFDRGDLASAWPLTDKPFRLALAQGWIMMNADLPEVAGEGRDQLATALSEDQPSHALWPLFAGWRVVRWRQVLPHLLDADARSVVVIRDEAPVVTPDLEVVTLTRSAERAIGPGEELSVQRFLVRFGTGGQRLAGIGRVLPLPGWPPSETDPYSV
jgi:hypothetical protein